LIRKYILFSRTRPRDSVCNHAWMRPAYLHFAMDGVKLFLPARPAGNHNFSLGPAPFCYLLPSVSSFCMPVSMAVSLFPLRSQIRTHSRFPRRRQYEVLGQVLLRSLYGSFLCSHNCVTFFFVPVGSFSQRAGTCGVRGDLRAGGESFFFLLLCCDPLLRCTLFFSQAL